MGNQESHGNWEMQIPVLEIEIKSLKVMEFKNISLKDVYLDIRFVIFPFEFGSENPNQ